MSKQLTDIIKPFTDMSYEDKAAVVNKIRHNKYVAKPALKQHKKKASTKKKKASNKKIVDLLKSMNPEELAKILETQNNG